MTKRWRMITIMLAIIAVLAALGGAVVIVASAPKTSADEMSRAAFGH